MQPLASSIVLMLLGLQWFRENRRLSSLRPDLLWRPAPLFIHAAAAFEDHLHRRLADVLRQVLQLLFVQTVEGEAALVFQRAGGCTCLSAS